MKVGQYEISFDYDRTVVIDGPRGPVHLSRKEFSRKLFIALRKNNKKGR